MCAAQVRSTARPLVGEGVNPAGRPAPRGIPGGANQPPSLLHGPEGPIEEARVDLHLGKALQKLVPVDRPLGQGEEDPGLGEAADAAGRFTAVMPSVAAHKHLPALVI